MPRRGKYVRVPRPVTMQEKLFIHLIHKGIKRTKAYKMAFPDNKNVKLYMDAVKTDDKETKKKAMLRIKSASAEKLQTQYMQNEMEVYTERMNKLANDALTTVDDIMNDPGASKKVRADLAMEMIRHKVGTPTQKIKQETDKHVTISFGEPHKDDDIRDVESIIEGEVV